ncbi:MAG: hypothetical protein ACJAS3_002679 [Roseivirga sp.]|jgi:hypothetical protein
MIYDKTTLDDLRLEGDVLADQAVSSYFPSRKAELQIILDGLEINSSKLPSTVSDDFKHLYNSVLKPLNDLEEEKVAKGHDFFSKNASDIMLLLGFLSLPYCYAAAKGAQVLGRSNRIIAEPGKRLLETAEFVFDITQPKAFEPRGKGFISILKVRLIHAVIRWYVTNSGTWDQDQLGVPVNQEDMAGTNLSFSLIPVRGMRKIGINILPKESDAYIQFWNFIGSRLGLNDLLLPKNNKECYVLEKRIRERHFESSAIGKELTASLLKYFESVTVNSPIEGKSKAFVQYMLGDQISDLLGIKVDQVSRLSFRPFPELMKVKNVLLRKDDNYLSAFTQFKARSGEMTDESIELVLPKGIK